MKKATRPGKVEVAFKSIRPQFTAKSVATQAQYVRIIDMLRVGEKSTFDFRKAGVMSPAARIKELNDEHGYSIPTVARRDLYDAEGFMHPRVAVYALRAEPQEDDLC